MLPGVDILQAGVGTLPGIGTLPGDALSMLLAVCSFPEAVLQDRMPGAVLGCHLVVALSLSKQLI